MTRLRHVRSLLFLFFLTSGLVLSACGEYAAKGAGTGATTGAVSGAVGGLVSALVFGGDPAQAAARGAVYGGAVGATAGAMAGAQVDSKVKEQRDATAEALRAKIGDDAFAGLAALADCEHEDALKQAALARQSENPNFSLAGLWLEVLAFADQGNEAQARDLFPDVVKQDWDIETATEAEATMRDTLNKLMDIRDQANARGLFPEVVETDWDISTEAEAEATLQDTLNKLMDIREQYNLPRVCSG